MARSEGEIRGLPTLMAVFPTKLEYGAVVTGLKSAGYGAGNIMVYYRVKGSDQVIYADTGRIAPGQALESSPVLNPSSHGENLDTLVLVHPESGEADAVKAALMMLGEAEIYYEDATVAGGRAAGSARQETDAASPEG